VTNADEDDLSHAMDGLLARQARIEQKLANRHLVPGRHVLYDVTSSYDEGRTCPFARLGDNRDQKQGTTSIVYGVLTERDGRPVAVEAYRGNTADPTTIPAQGTKRRPRFGLEQIVWVGDRGTLTQNTNRPPQKVPRSGLDCRFPLRGDPQARGSADVDPLTVGSPAPRGDPLCPVSR